MTAAKKLPLLSEEDYLAGELASPVKHEYVDGTVYAMAGARNFHNDIAANVLAFCAGCAGRAAASSIPMSRSGSAPMAVLRIYPDTGVTCRPNPRTDSFEDNPAVIAEVLSASMRRTDEEGKRDAYLSIPSLCAYLLIEQEFPFVVVHRRAGAAFVREEYAGLEAVIPLPEIGTAAAAVRGLRRSRVRPRSGTGRRTSLTSPSRGLP